MGEKLTSLRRLPLDSKSSLRTTATHIDLRSRELGSRARTNVAHRARIASAKPS